MPEIGAAASSGEAKKSPCPPWDSSITSRNCASGSSIPSSPLLSVLASAGGRWSASTTSCSARSWTRSKPTGMSEKLVYLNPTEPFNLYLKIAALAGLFLTSPFVLYQVWMFISPGPLPQREALRRAVHGFDDHAVFGRRILRLQDRLPSGAGFPDSLRKAIPADDHDRRIHFAVSEHRISAWD